MIGTTSFGISDQLAICTPHADNAGMLLHVNGKFTMETFKPSLCCTVSLYIGPPIVILWYSTDNYVIRTTKLTVE
jgi:hypothetical protein